MTAVVSGGVLLIGKAADLMGIHALRDPGPLLPLHRLHGYQGSKLRGLRSIGWMAVQTEGAGLPERERHLPEYLSPSWPDDEEETNR
jgi:hypothetical protein